jgi:exportin-2 (importin alpha re-exporter)
MISISNSILHIIESILSQEELPDFYEENLEQISQLCIYLLDTDFGQLQTSKDFELLFKVRAKVVRMV